MNWHSVYAEYLIKVMNEHLFIILIITIFLSLDIQDLLASPVERSLSIFSGRFPHSLFHALVKYWKEEGVNLHREKSKHR